MTRTRTTSDPEIAVRANVDSDVAIAPHTEVRAAGRVLANATTQLLPGPAGTTLNIHIECAAGHQPPRARRLLVHDLLNRAERARIDRVLMVIPLGDTEILDTLRERCRTMTTRSAGSTCIVEAEIGPEMPRAHAG